MPANGPGRKFSGCVTLQSVQTISRTVCITPAQHQPSPRIQWMKHLVRSQKLSASGEDIGKIQQPLHQRSITRQEEKDHRANAAEFQFSRLPLIQDVERNSGVNESSLQHAGLDGAELVSHPGDEPASWSTSNPAGQPIQPVWRR